MAVELSQHHSQDRGEEEQQQPKCPVHPSAYKHFVPPPKQQQQQQQHGAVREGDGEDGGALARGAACPVTEHSKSGREAAAAAAPRRAPGDGEGCPVGAEQPPGAERQPWPAETDPRNGMPAAAEQHRAPVQRRRLSTRRELSTIPMAVETHAPPAPAPSSSSSSGSGCSSATTASATGPLDDASSPSGKKKNDASRVWVYPSEQMFFNAMRRKSWDPREEDMKVVVPIHNAVNERCWKEILEWESAHDSAECGGPKLVRFEGKPKSYTPKARLNALLGYTLPFDRHDWVVSRCGGQQVTYVIDFYSGKPDPRDPDLPSFFLDVRPAFTPVGVRDRVRRWWRDLF